MMMALAPAVPSTQAVSSSGSWRDGQRKTTTVINVVGNQSGEILPLTTISSRQKSVRTNTTQPRSSAESQRFGVLFCGDRISIVMRTSGRVQRSTMAYQAPVILSLHASTSGKEKRGEINIARYSAN